MTSDRTYTHPDVLGRGVEQGWAEPETDPARIDWPARQARAAIPFQVIGGRPVNPFETTRIRYGRNEMGYWGENLMADALVTLWCAGRRYVLMVERDDGYGWAVPGGHTEPGETAVQTAVRELAEETGLTVPASACRAAPPLYAPDPRASGEAWAVTIPVHINLPARGALPAVAGGDDARRAAWIPAATYSYLVTALARDHGGKVFAAHTGMLQRLLGGQVPGCGVVALPGPAEGRACAGDPAAAAAGEMLVILTVSKPDRARGGVEYVTGRWTLTPGPRMTKAGLLDWALGQIPERVREDSTVLFFTAEPNSLPVCR